MRQPLPEQPSQSSQKPHEYLSRFGQILLDNLKSERPKMYAELVQTRKLRGFLLSRQNQAKRAMDAMYESGKTWDEAFEVVNEKFLSLPSEQEQPVLGGPTNEAFA